MPIEQPLPRASLPLGLIIALSGFGLLVTIVFVGMMIRSAGRAHRVALSATNGSIRIEPVTRPMAVTEGYSKSAAAQAGETALNSSNADQVLESGNETTFIKTFTLSDDTRVSLKNVNGNITVTAWDQPNAQVSVIGRSGSDRNAQVLFTNSGGNLSIRTAQTRGNQDVRFEVKLPHELGRLELSSQNGVIRLSDVTAEILIDATNGAIELANVGGVSKIRTTNGSIKATLLEASDRSMEFESTNGSIDLMVPPGFEADLAASTIHGTINVDDAFGVQVEKGIVGQTAKGEIGHGGERLKLATTNGNIKLTTAEPRAKESAKGKANGN
jgi:DUF4097 and DUF4098 domain-containing protein YvlB